MSNKLDMSNSFKCDEDYLDHLMNLFVENCVCIVPNNLKDRFEGIITRFNYDISDNGEYLIYLKRGVK